MKKPHLRWEGGAYRWEMLSVHNRSVRVATNGTTISARIGEVESSMGFTAAVGVVGRSVGLLRSGIPAAGVAVATWTRKISCYLCCFFGGCHWLPRRMKYQERPYNRTPLHSREAGREQTKTPQHIPFRLFYSQVPFQMHFKVPKKRHTYRSDRFCRINCHALSFLHRGGFVSRRCICSFNGDDARAPWPCNPPRIGRPCRR